MDQLQDRADVPIWNAIEASNYKQALKLVDKRLSKKPTDYLEALKYYIRSFSPLVSEKTAVLLHIEEQTKRKSPLVDLAIIELYDDALHQALGSTDEWARLMGEIRWQCVKTVPKNEDIGLKCFKACLAKKDLDHARQIANSLEKAFPGNREYIFWNLSMMFLFSKSQDYPANQTKLWGSLAFAQISKLAAATKQSKADDKPVARTIQKPQELLLLHLITETYGKPEQQLDYLEDSKLGPESTVAKGEWEIWRMRLRMIQEARRWTELFELTGSLLKRARTKDESGQLTEAHFCDWVVWDAYIESGFETSGSLCKGKVGAEIEAHLDPASGIDKSWRRNASLAWVTLNFKESGEFASDQAAEPSSSQKVDTILKYLSNYGDASTAYSDLRPFAEKLSVEERKSILSSLKSANSDLSTAKLITITTNKFKLRYLLTCSLPEAERQQSPKPSDDKEAFACITCGKVCGYSCQHCLKSLGQEAIEAYNTSLNENGEITKHLLITDRHPADDLCVLATTCLIKLGLMDTTHAFEPLESAKSRYFLQAVALLEKAWLHSKPNFQISLMLVRLYVFLGCGSLAMRAYQRLALKQIQLDTLSYVLFDRLSTFHPRPFASHAGEVESDRAPLSHLQKQQKVYKNAYEQIAKNIWLSFKNGSYNSMYHIENVEKELSHGLGAAMSVIEGRRISRLTEPGTLNGISHGYSLLAPSIEAPGILSADNLDYKSFPNYESTLSVPFEKLSRFAPVPSSHRFRSNLFSEKLFLILSASTSTGEHEMLLAWLKQHLDTLALHAGSKDDTKSTMTQPERLAHQAYQAMALVITEASDREQWAEPTLGDRLKALNVDLDKALQQILSSVEGLTALLPAYFETLHALYTAYEVGKAAKELAAYVSRQGKKVHETQKELSKITTEVAQRLLVAIEAKCVLVKKGMDEGWIDKVLECALAEGTWLDEDDIFMEEWAGEVVESWRESVAGLSYLKSS